VLDRGRLGGMALRIVGAGLGRTGTHSLKLALEQLLGGPCYHMAEVLGQHPEHMPIWTAALGGADVDWDALFDGYVATVDWPACSTWEPILAANPGALVLLSTRASTDEWYRSAHRTIFEAMRAGGDAGEASPFRAMTDAMGEAFGASWDDEAALRAAYERHNDHVRATAPPDRLVEWQPADGWAPLCAALGVAEPDEPFPVSNTTADFRTMFGLDGEGAN
jgi:hypothetical protein